MTPAAAIASLDSQLAEHGELVSAYRYTATTGNPRPRINVDDVPAFVRAFKPEELAGEIDQTSTNIVLSPTKLTALLPLKKNDKVFAQGRERNVELVKPVLMGNTLVRINLVVTG